MSRLPTKDELNQLVAVRPLQDMVDEQAVRILEAWDKNNRLGEANRLFEHAEVTSDGNVVVHFDVDGPCGAYKDALTFSFDDFLNQS